MKEKYPFKRNGYIYSPGTAKGFLRMQRQGIPRPLFSIENRLARLLKKRYEILARKLLKELKAKFKDNGMVLDSQPIDEDAEENLEDLLEFFSHMGEELKKENEEIAQRANAQAIANTLEHEWFEEQQEEIERLDEQFKGDIEKIFRKEQTDYLNRLYEDADGRTKDILASFAIDKKQFFENNMDAVRTLYIDNSLQRIAGEEELIKRKILGRIIDYAENKTDKLKLDDLTKEAYDSTDHLSRLFARDQMQRFNKACTLATFRSAGVTKVKWVTSNDQRVRKSHKDLNGRIFSVNDLPAEVDDYNCRCGLVPVEWADD